MSSSLIIRIAVVALAALSCGPSQCATVNGYVVDPNWYAEHPLMTGLYGVGQYEYGVAGNIVSSSLLGFYGSTDVYGGFLKTGQSAGFYTLASWDVWWRSAFAFNQDFTNDFKPRAILRLHANMWSYGPTWGADCNEFGQMFAASGSSVVMVIVRSPLAGINFTASVHDGGPSGPQIGPSRSFTSPSGPSDVRLIWSGGEVPTVPGNLYYLKIKAAGTTRGILCDNDPVPDMSDPMPEGSLYLDGSPAHPSRDLGVTICSDDDGILTNMYIRSGGSPINVTQVGQTFTARGTSLISFTAWIPDGNNTYVATLYNGVGGTQIGTAKKARTTRPGADPEIIWTWNPGECPLTPGNVYYIEVTREGGGSVYCYGNQWDLYAGGRAYGNRSPLAQGLDMAGTIMEEESPGSATKPTVQFNEFPRVEFADRGTTTLTVRWTTNVQADSTVEYAAWDCPYTHSYYDSTATYAHTATLTGLQPNTMYHIRVKSARSGYRTGVTRDFVACTINEQPNLLANPSFEAGSGASPRKPIPNWTFTGDTDIGASDGTWFGSLPAYAGSWFAQAAKNASSGQGTLYQTVAVTPGARYNFTVAVSSHMIENNKWKYDVWNQWGRLPWIRIGLDPYGGHNPSSGNVQWTQRMYSHRRYTTIGISRVAASNQMSVFIQYGQQGGDWLLFGFDDCRLSAHLPYNPYDLGDLKSSAPDGVYAEVGGLIITAVPSEAGAYYAETEDRTLGIRVSSTDVVPVGRKVTVRGQLATDSQTGERSLAGASLVNPVAAAQPEPLLMLPRSVGGGALGLIPAVPGSQGPHNTGLAVKVVGEVTVRDPGGAYVYINDGSMPGDGLRVNTSSVSSSLVPNVGEVVSLSGISSLHYSGGVKPLLIVRRSDDVAGPYSP